MNSISITVYLLSALLYLSVGWSCVLTLPSTPLEALLKNDNIRFRLVSMFCKALTVIFWPYGILVVSNALLKEHFADKYGLRFPLIGLFVSVLLLAKVIESEGIDLWKFLIERLYLGGFWDFLGNFYLIAVVSIAVTAFSVMVVETLLWGDYL